MVREHRGGSKHSHRALERGGGARAESLWLATPCTKRGGRARLGLGESGGRGNGAIQRLLLVFVMPDLCGYESKEIVNSVRDAEGC